MRRKKHTAYGHPLSRWAAQMAEPSATTTGADLIVVLNADYEVIAREFAGGSAVRTAAMAAIAAIENERFLEQFWEQICVAEVFVITLPLARQICVHGVVKVVATVCVEAITALFR